MECSSTVMFPILIAGLFVAHDTNVRDNSAIRVKQTSTPGRKQMVSLAKLE